MQSRTVTALSLSAVIVALGIAWTASAAGTPNQSLAIYRSEQWHFAIAVPADMKVDTTEQRGVEQIIQFNDGEGRWFNIVAAPYTQLDVAIGEEAAPNVDSDQSTSLGVVNVYRNEA